MMTTGAGRLRLILAGILLVGGAVLVFEMLPPYLDSLSFQRYLERVAGAPESRSQPPEQLRALIVNEATRRGLPVRFDQIEIRRTPERFRVDVRYVVRVDLTVYTVDLHFRNRAGG